MLGDERGKPQLLAILLCERVLLEEDGAASIVRIIDTFNVDVMLAPANEAARKDPSPPKTTVPLECELFTRWGPGEGNFTQELRVLRPDGVERPLGEAYQFTKPTGFHFQQLRHRIRLRVTDPGVYAFRVYLDGQLMGEHPFTVNVNVDIDMGETEESEETK